MMSRVLQGVTLLLLLAFAAALAVSLVREAWGPPAPGPIAAYLEIAPEPPKLVFETARRSWEASVDFPTLRATEARRIRLDGVLRRALDRLGADGWARPAALGEPDDALAWLKEHLEVTSTGEGRFLRVALRGGLRPAEQVALINGVVDAYIGGVHQERAAWGGEQEALRQKLWRYQHELRGRREDLQQLVLAVTDGIDGTPNLPPGLLEELSSRTVAELARLQAELRAAQAERRVRAPTGGSDGDTGPSGLDERIAILTEQVRRTKEEAVEYATLAERNAPAADFLRDEIRLLEELVGEIGRELRRIEFEADAPPRVKVVDRAAVPTGSPPLGGEPPWASNVR